MAIDPALKLSQTQRAFSKTEEEKSDEGTISKVNNVVEEIKNFVSSQEILISKSGEMGDSKVLKKMGAGLKVVSEKIEILSKPIGDAKDAVTIAQAALTHPENPVYVSDVASGIIVNRGISVLDAGFLSLFLSPIGAAALSIADVYLDKLNLNDPELMKYLPEEVITARLTQFCVNKIANPIKSISEFIGVDSEAKKIVSDAIYKVGKAYLKGQEIEDLFDRAYISGMEQGKKSILSGVRTLGQMAKEIIKGSVVQFVRDGIKQDELFRLFLDQLTAKIRSLIPESLPMIIPRQKYSGFGSIITYQDKEKSFVQDSSKSSKLFLDSLKPGPILESEDSKKLLSLSSSGMDLSFTGKKPLVSGEPKTELVQSKPPLQSKISDFKKSKSVEAPKALENSFLHDSLDSCSQSTALIQSGAQAQNIFQEFNPKVIIWSTASLKPSQAIDVKSGREAACRMAEQIALCPEIFRKIPSWLDSLSTIYNPQTGALMISLGETSGFSDWENLVLDRSKQHPRPMCELEKQIRMSDAIEKKGCSDLVRRSVKPLPGWCYDKACCYTLSNGSKILFVYGEYKSLRRNKSNHVIIGWSHDLDDIIDEDKNLYAREKANHAKQSVVLAYLNELEKKITSIQVKFSQDITSFIKNEEFAKAEDLIRSAKLINPVALKVASAKVYVAEKKYSQAIPYLLTLHTQNPSNEVIKDVLANCYFQTEQYDKFLSIYPKDDAKKLDVAAAYFRKSTVESRVKGYDIIKGIETPAASKLAELAALLEVKDLVNAGDEKKAIVLLESYKEKTAKEATDNLKVQLVSLLIKQTEDNSKKILEIFGRIKTQEAKDYIINKLGIEAKITIEKKEFLFSQRYLSILRKIAPADSKTTDSLAASLLQNRAYDEYLSLFPEDDSKKIAAAAHCSQENTKEAHAKGCDILKGIETPAVLQLKAEIALLEANRLDASGDGNGAIACLESVKEKTDNVKVRLAFLLIKQPKDNAKKVLEILDGVLLPEAYSIKAIIAVANKEYVLANQHLNGLLAINQRNKITTDLSDLALKAKVESILGKHEDAIAHFELVLSSSQFKTQLENNSSLTEFFCFLGDSYKALKKYDKALESYEKHLNIHPDDMDKRAVCGFCHLSLQQINLAEKDFDFILENDKNSPVALMGKSVISFQKGDEIKAAGFFEKAQQKGAISPEHADLCNIARQQYQIILTRVRTLEQAHREFDFIQNVNTSLRSPLDDRMRVESEVMAIRENQFALDVARRTRPEMQHSEVHFPQMSLLDFHDVGDANIF